VKHVVEDATAETRTHPVYASAGEQWERWVQNIQDLAVSEAYVSLRRRQMPSLFGLHRVSHSVTRIRTLPVPHPRVAPETLAAVEDTYLARYFTPVAAIEAQRAQPAVITPPRRSGGREPLNADDSNR